MRCPPGLVFDDLYQRCEWPGAGSQGPTQRVGSLRDNKLDDNHSSKLKLKKLRLMTTAKSNNATATATPSSLSSSSSSTTAATTNQTGKSVQP